MAWRLFHWGPLITLSIIKWVSISTVYCSTMLWPPASSWSALANLAVFLLLSSFTTFHFLCAMFEGPGYLPKMWKPEKEEDTKCLQNCNFCQGYKAPRAHHCRKCERCVMKMDHHCPWINNCVGHFNHGHFILFLFFAVLGCAQGAFVLSVSLYYGINRSWYMYYGTGDEPIVVLTVWNLLVVMFALGLAIGVVLAVGALLFLQFRAVWRNQTGIEDWILEKAAHRLKDTDRVFYHPYYLGRWKNLRQVFTFSCSPPCNGINWPLRPGSGKYDLTLEQLQQKIDKRLRTRQYTIMRPYFGSVFPLWSQGLRVACHPPYTDEPRIVLQKGDVVKVTRWKKYWLYGDKLVAEDEPRSRGWFPRRCAVEKFDSSNRRNDSVETDSKKVR